MSSHRRQCSKKYGKVVSALTTVVAGASSVAASAVGIALPAVGVPVLAAGVGCGVVAAVMSPLSKYFGKKKPKHDNMVIKTGMNLLNERMSKAIEDGVITDDEY